MATNPFFNNFSFQGEQDLLESLTAESVKIYGINVYYMPRTLGPLDDLLNEDDLPSFNSAYEIEMYVKNVEGFEGQGDFLSKFGLEIRDAITLSVSNKRFTEETSLATPKEGDLIYFPLNKKIYEVMFIERESAFYQTGKLMFSDLKIELMEFSNQRFNTGIAEIDNLFNDITTLGINNIETVDDIADNETIEQEGLNILDFTEENPFGDDQF